MLSNITEIHNYIDDKIMFIFQSQSIDGIGYN